jgi:diguanylate cyclase (GGDEF)-like protein/PAS domain S-box-containing protein
MPSLPCSTPSQHGPLEQAADTFQVEVARSLAGQPLVGMAIIEVDRFAYLNAHFAETFGYRPESMLTIPAMEIFAHSSRLRVTQYVRETLAGQPQPRAISCEAVKKDGTAIFLDLACSRMELSGKTYALCVITDASARVAAERKVQALNRRLAELEVEDALTGLYNRRFTEASLERELLQAERSGLPVSLVVCDIDGFKTINETFGREAGDQVLKAFASLLKRRCRKSDITCRFGGEEFLVVFPGMPADVAAAWAEKTRLAVDAVKITRDATSLGIAASFGVATYPEDAQNQRDLIAAADAAQYAAKAAGGNQVKAAQPNDPVPQEWVCPPSRQAANPACPDLSHIVAREG